MLNIKISKSRGKGRCLKLEHLGCVITLYIFLLHRKKPTISNVTSMKRMGSTCTSYVYMRSYVIYQCIVIYEINTVTKCSNSWSISVAKTRFVIVINFNENCLRVLDQHIHPTNHQREKRRENRHFLYEDTNTYRKIAIADE